MAAFTSSAFAQNPLHGHYVFLSSSETSLTSTPSTTTCDITTLKNLNGRAFSLDQAVSAHYPFGAPGSGTSGNATATYNVQMKVKWVPDAGETVKPNDQSAQWDIGQYREASVNFMYYAGETGHTLLIGAVADQDPALTDFNWTWTKGAPTSLTTIDTRSSPAPAVVEGAFKFADVNGEWIGTGNFAITISYSYGRYLSQPRSGNLKGRLIKILNLAKINGLSVL